MVVCVSLNAADHSGRSESSPDMVNGINKPPASGSAEIVKNHPNIIDSNKFPRNLTLF